MRAPAPPLKLDLAILIDEQQQARCPWCCRPMYLFMGAAGPAWTCGCAGPEKGRAAEDRQARRKTK